VSSARQLAKNSTINLIGQGLPLLVALFAMPKILHNLGDERLGLLALAWMFIGYFTLFDLGLGRAVTKELAYWLPKSREGAVEVFWTGMISTFLLGLGASLLFWLLTPIFTERLLVIPSIYIEEARGSFFAIAIGLPFVISSVSLKGVLEARGSFLSINLVQIPLGILNYLIPAVISHNQPNLALIVDSLILIRIASWLFLVVMVFTMFPGGLDRPKFSVKKLRELLSFGGWITLVNAISPLIGYADRFIVGALISAAAVAYYSTPYEMVMKLWIIPSSICAVLFPAFSAMEKTDYQRQNNLLIAGAKLMLFIMFPIGFMLSIFSHEVLSLWLGHNFSTQSWEILWWLGFAIVINSVGFVPSAFLQSRGRPDLPARILLVELPFYLALLFVMLDQFGVKGAAMAWFIRTVVDVSLLFYFSFRQLNRNLIVNFKMMTVLLSFGAFFGVSAVDYFKIKMVASVLVTVVFVLVFWMALLNSSERAWIKALFRQNQA